MHYGFAPIDPSIPPKDIWEILIVKQNGHDLLPHLDGKCVFPGNLSGIGGMKTPEDEDFCCRLYGVVDDDLPFVSRLNRETVQEIGPIRCGKEVSKHLHDV